MFIQNNTLLPKIRKIVSIQSTYIFTNIHDGRAEIIDITSKLYANKMAEYNAKVGKWLDSQK